MNGGSCGSKVAVLSISEGKSTRSSVSSGAEGFGACFDVARARITEPSALHEPDANKGCRVGVVEVMFEYGGSLILGIASVCLPDAVAIIILKKTHEVHGVRERVGWMVGGDSFYEQVVDVGPTLAVSISIGHAEILAIGSRLAQAARNVRGTMISLVAIQTLCAVLVAIKSRKEMKSMCERASERKRHN